MTWLDAQAKVNNLGGSLLVIHDATEQAHYASVDINFKQLDWSLSKM